MTKAVRILFATLFAAVTVFAATLSAPDQTANPGDSVVLSVALSSAGQSVSGVQFDLAWDTGLDVHLATGAQTGISTKSLYASFLQPRVLRCVVTGLNRTVVADGEILRLFISVASSVPAGTSQLRFLNLSATDSSGGPVFLTGGLISIQVQPGSATHAIQPDGLVNAASLAAGPVSPGEIITLFGAVSGATPVVLFNGLPATILYAGTGQVNAIVPFGLDLSSPAQFEVRQGSSSFKSTVPVTAAAPAIFTLSASGTGAGAILNQNYGVNSPMSPASRGSVIMVYATGFGALNPLPVDGQLQHVLAITGSPVTATIGGVPAQVVYAGAAPGLVAGAMQINIRVPDTVAANLAAPISVTMGGVTTPPGVTVSVQ